MTRRSAWCVWDLPPCFEKNAFRDEVFSRLRPWFHRSSMRPLRAVPDANGEPPRLQVLVGGAHIAATHSPARPGARAELGRDARFREIYERWFDDVVGWLYALGAPMSDTEDLAQEIFLVVRRKLNRFDGGNLAGWLYRISQLTVRDHRRRAWFRH